MIKKFLTKRELRLFKDRKILPVHNWNQFVQSFKSNEIEVYGYGMAELFDCVGMAYYLLWKGKSGQIYYSYVTGNIISLLEK